MKEPLNPYIKDYLKQLESEHVAKGYKGLMEYLMSLRTHFINQYPEEFVVGNFYQGYMDMSYFPITPRSLKDQKLKIGLVFNHENIQFELWLVGQNKQIQKKHWEILHASDLDSYHLSETTQRSIIEHIILVKPEFNNLDVLTQNIEQETLQFIADIEKILAE